MVQQHLTSEGNQLIMDMDLNPTQDVLFSNELICCPRADTECYNENGQHGEGFDRDNPRNECDVHACPEVMDAVAWGLHLDREDRIYGTGQGL